MDNRAVSVTVSYTMTLMIATILIGGLLTASGAFIDRQSDRAIHDELDVIGQTLAANLMTADRMISVGKHDATVVDAMDTSDIDVRIETDLPTRIAGSSYTIRVIHDADSNAELILRSQSPDVEVRVPLVVENMAPDYDETVRGGTIELYTQDGALEVQNS